MPEISQERLDQLERTEASHAAAMAGRLRAELTAALTTAKCRPDALADAAALLAAGAQAQVDDQGRIMKLTAGGKEYASPSDAAAAFLSERAYLVSSTEPHKAAPPTTTEPFGGLNPAELVSKAWTKQ